MLRKTVLKLHNCFVYFIQKINPWRMVFYFLFYCSGYWVIKDISLLFFNIAAPPKQRPDHSGVRHTLYNQDIKCTKWQITVIIEKRVEDF